MRVWVAIQEACEVKNRDAVLGVAASVEAAKRLAEETTEFDVLWRLREDGTVWRGEVEDPDETEFFVYVEGDVVAE